jgi:hypothetical protein
MKSTVLHNLRIKAQKNLKNLRKFIGSATAFSVISLAVAGENILSRMFSFNLAG